MARKNSRKAQRTVRTTSVTPEGIYEPFNIDTVPWRKTPGSTTYKRLGRFGGGSRVGVGIDVLEPKQYSNRFHYHLHEEEHIFIIKGSATLVLGTRRYLLHERDYCCFPAGQKAGHHLFNHTSEKCTFMTIGEHRPDDVVCFPEAGRARIRATGKTVPISAIAQASVKIA
jgi:uncharacterized cupin superfamily protein